MFLLWLGGLFRHRLTRMAGIAAGIALTVSLVASLALFLFASTASMTTRAASAVPIDWQVQVVPGTDPATVEQAIGQAVSATALHQVFYAATDGFAATTGGTVQTTGPGQAIAFDKGYLDQFPNELRLLSGSLDGALVAQQTAANLHVAPGDQVQVKRPTLPDATVTITGVVDLPDADSLFQAVGLPKQAAPQAPPDNVLILPPAAWHGLFDPQGAARPDSTHVQFHVRLDHSLLPAQPTAAWTQVTGSTHNLEARVAGQALVADNLGARLDAVRGDALYATVLFLFLGLPGAALGAALTIAIAASGGQRRRAEQALLRLRGANRRRVLTFAMAEAGATGVLGICVGLIAAFLFVGVSGAGAMTATLLATAVGIALAAAAVVLPAWLALFRGSVVAQRQTVGRGTAPLWQRAWLDLVALAAAGLLFWQTASTGYQVVLAPEGVAATSVDYKAFLAPALFWIGAALLTVRIVSVTIRSNGRVLQTLLQPLARRLSGVVGSALSHQSRRITLGVAMTALAVAFGSSTAIFNTTYSQQSRVDAELTNGADVTVFGTAAAPAGPQLKTLAALPGVRYAEPMQHRFAYVGTDLQDLYGIDPATLGNATNLSNAFFSGGSASAILARLTSTPDGVLVSAETVNDFQLKLGDTINLRLLGSSDHQYHPVPFHFVGVSREFPTAPRDSFLVANAAYVAKMTGDPTAEYVLMRAASDPAALADAARKAVPPGLTVKDIGSVSHIIGSSLTAVSMTGMTRIELTFAIVMAAAAAGLMLALGFDDRRRGYAVLTALGARQNQVGGFLRAEGALVILGGIGLGLVTGWIVAWMLVKLLTGVFDPPPEALAIPWGWLFLLALLTAPAAAAAVEFAVRRVHRNATTAMRDL